MNCSHCGAPQEGNLHFCTHCGQSLGTNPAADPMNPNPNQPMYGANPVPMQPVYPVLQVPEDHKPISAWGYLGYTLLFCLPVIGLIFIAIYSFGGTKNINLRNYARSYGIIWIASAIIALLYVVLMFVIFFGGLAAFTSGGAMIL